MFISKPVLTQLAQEKLPPEHGAQATMRTVVSEAERLERLVSDLLDFARPKKSQVQEFDVAELISDIRTMLQQKFQEAGVKLETSAPTGLTIRSDPGGLRQVLLNVISNALDAVPRGSRVVVRARVEQARANAPRSGSLLELEKGAILDALARNKGDRKLSAEELGISLRTLQYRLKEYGVSNRD